MNQGEIIRNSFILRHIWNDTVLGCGAKCPHKGKFCSLEAMQLPVEF